MGNLLTFGKTPGSYRSPGRYPMSKESNIGSKLRTNRKVKSSNLRFRPLGLRSNDSLVPQGPTHSQTFVPLVDPRAKSQTLRKMTEDQGGGVSGVSNVILERPCRTFNTFIFKSVDYLSVPSIL